MNLAHAILLLARPEAVPVNPIARWEWVFPVVETLHVLGFTLLVGTVVILDLRLLGWRLQKQPVSQVARDLSPWIWTGIIVQLISGPYLFSGDPFEYVQVTAFRVKMTLLLVALIFHFTAIRAATAPARDAQPLGWRRLAAVVSVGLWVSVVLGGMWIGNL
ncbi:MAG: DUF6644 family protein [Candidatus Acidiferrales bacterium]